MKKILTVLGARPQFIKASVVSHAFRQSRHLHEVLVHTGQHFDTNMSDVFFDELGMYKPDHFLGIHGGGHGAMTGRMLERLEQVMQTERPDAVLVYGDTNSTLAGALAAVKLHIPVAHVEAGLRSFNMAMPEEVNRILTDRVSRWLFTPTRSATQNLLNEGVVPSSIEEVGDVMYDVALHHGHRVQPGTGLMERLGLSSKGYVLATVHRAENTDHPERLAVIVEALMATAQQISVVWPLHPRTRSVLEKSGTLDALAAQVQVIDPVGYLDMVQLEKFSALIATDSGGVQKEAFFYQVPCVTLRNETEWVELITSGWNRLAPPSDVGSLVQAFNAALGSKGQAVGLYGVGNAAEQIIKFLEATLD
ncbi:MAG: UDP-N-acetylglucosamine 2-epimerase (non-hydrolyzing) [Dethiobacter sp.]|nr:UDP-N-acetylglucosamine 2-epimerase (non-hydrolyzing) [Dethiobacter sp.]